MSESTHSSAEHVWDMIKKVGVAMFITHHGDTMDGRPLQAYPAPGEGMIYFMTDSEHVLRDTAAAANVLLSFASKGGNDFVALDGTAEIRDDRAKIRELWSHWAEAYWDGPEDPAIRIIAVRPKKARYWDAPNAIVTTIAIVASAVMGKDPKIGESGDVQM
jgi:general stress protein 26